MARTQFKVTFTNAQPGAPVSVLMPSVEHVFSTTTAVKPVGGKQLYLDATNSITVWSDAQDVIAQTVDGAGLFIQGTATVASPTVTVGDGTAPTNPAGSAASVPAGGTTGQVLGKNTNADNDVGWKDTATLSNATPLAPGAAGASGTGTAATRDDHVHPRGGQLAGTLKRSGAYLTFTGGLTNASAGSGFMVAAPIILAQSTALSSIGIQITAFVAATTVRLGIYADDGTMQPGALVAGSVGAVAGTANGFVEAVISVTLAAGTYWLAAVQEGGAPTLAGVNSTAMALPAPSANLANGTVVGYATNSITAGSLPSTWPGTAFYQAGTSVGNSVPRVLIKVA